MASEIEFGFYPRRMDFSAGDISVRSLDRLEENGSALLQNKNHVNGWLYCPTKLHSHRTFGLPKSHAISHTRLTSIDCLEFVVWVLSFFCGMRFSTSQMGFLDCTPIVPGKLVDFIVVNDGFPKVAALAEKYWTENISNLPQVKRLVAAINLLYFAQNPQLLQFERFHWLYSSVDACFAIAKEIDKPKTRVNHADVIKYLCERFSIPTPHWAVPQPGSRNSQLSDIRNMLTHEALLAGEPAGFGVLDPESSQIPLQLEALLCRLIVAILGSTNTAYVRSAVLTRETYSLEL